MDADASAVMPAAKGRVITDEHRKKQPKADSRYFVRRWKFLVLRGSRKYHQQ